MEVLEERLVVAWARANVPGTMSQAQATLNALNCDGKKRYAISPIIKPQTQLPHT